MARSARASSWRRTRPRDEPFGAIDTPGQGETISGTNYANFGWVLSRVRRADPPGGGSVFVYIDGVAVGSPGGWASRADLTALFPGYPGINTALGVFRSTRSPTATASTRSSGS